MFYEPHIETHELLCPRLPIAFDRLSLLHLSDLHITRWTKRLDLWEAALGHLRPDVLVVTGDLGHRSWQWKKALPHILRLLHAVEPPLGRYVILGNHDTLRLGTALETHGITCLKNQAIFLTPTPRQETPAKIPLFVPPKNPPPAPASPRLALVGIHQHRRIDTDIPTALRHVHPRDFKLLLLHYPDLVHQAAAAGADVCLAGHTHGGQICWPDGSPIIRHDTLHQTLCTGIHQFNTTWMVVNRGIGVAGLRMRLFCPPQAVLLTLRAEKKPPRQT